MKHEIFNESDRGIVFTYVLDWLDARIVSERMIRSVS